MEGSIYRSQLGDDFAGKFPEGHSQATRTHFKNASTGLAQCGNDTQKLVSVAEKVTCRQCLRHLDKVSRGYRPRRRRDSKQISILPVGEKEDGDSAK